MAPLLADARKFYHRDVESRRQDRHSWEELWLAEDVVAALMEVFGGKCAYCEQQISQPVVDHFRPLANASGDDEPAPDHYWWLAYDWDNLYASCRDCSYHKGEKFPLDPSPTTPKLQGRAPLEAGAERLAAESHLLLDPCRDEPLEHLRFHYRSGLVEARSPRGEATIEVLSLNRSDLVELRLALAVQTNKLLQQLTKLLKANQSFQLGRALAKLVDAGRPFRSQTLYQTAPWLNRHRTRLQTVLPPDILDRLGVVPVSDRIRKKAAARKSTKSVASVSRLFSPMLAAVLKSALEGSVAQMAPVSPSKDARSVPPARQRAKKPEFRTALIESVAIKNFRALASLRLEFPRAAILTEGTPRPPATPVQQGAGPTETVSAPWMMLLGENGAGKSSVLQAIALTLAGDAARRHLGVMPEDVLRVGTSEGSVRIDLSGESAPVTLRFEAGDTSFRATPAEPEIQVFAYGATRLLPKRRARAARDPGPVRVGNLFDAFTPLVDAHGWLTDLWQKKKSGKDPGSFDNQALAFKDLLSISQKARLTGGEDDGPPTIRIAGVDLTFDKLSDGYQSVVALAADVMKGLYARQRNRRQGARVETLEGLVLLDEIGAHLHPRWKMEVVHRLRRAFPRIQFVVTTHEPLCLRGLNDGEITVLRRGSRGGIRKMANLPGIRGLRVDQLLTSEHFGLNSTVDPELERWIDEYYKLLRVRRLSASQQARKAQLQEMIDDRQQLGTTRRERMLLEAIDEHLAHEPTVTSDTERRRLKARTRSRLKQMWEGS